MSQKPKDSELPSFPMRAFLELAVKIDRLEGKGGNLVEVFHQKEKSPSSIKPSSFERKKQFAPDTLPP